MNETASPSRPASAGQPGRRPPGLYFETRAPAATPASDLASGVPVFVGFATVDPALFERAGSRAVMLDDWSAAQWEGEGPICPARGSHLRAAVRGFFANGGERCVLLPLAPPPDAGASEDVLLSAFVKDGALDDRSDIDLVCVPDAVRPWLATVDAWRRVALAVLRHCERMGDRLALLDAPPIDATTGVESWHQLASGLRSSHGALYAPWILPDPTRDAGRPLAAGAVQWRSGMQPSTAARAAPLTRLVPPCGHVAGLVARIDRRLGPQHAPANAMLEGVLDTAVEIDAGDRGRLDEAGVNCIHGVRGRGVRVGGARTLSRDPVLCTVSGARVVLGFRRWLAARNHDLVFETQSPRLWEVLRQRVGAQCLAMQRAGALVDGPPEHAFFVKCDAETNPPESMALARVVAHVGLAPTVPAEYIVVRLVQDASGFTISGLS